MMKKVIAACLFFLMVIAMTACTAEKPATTPDNQTAVTTAATTTAAATTVTTTAAATTTAATTAVTTTAAATTTAATTTAATTESNSGGLRPEFKEAMDAYETFYDEYCELMKKYSKDPTNLSLLSEYTAMLQKTTEIEEAFAKWNSADMNTEELKYYLDVTTRVSKKLLDTM